MWFVGELGSEIWRFGPRYGGGEGFDVLVEM